jgi:flagella basal body P-ring formation protein FlgA
MARSFGQIVAVLVAAALAGNAPAGVTVVTLRPAATLRAGGGNVTLADVASIDGDDAAALGAITVARGPGGGGGGGAVDVPIDAVRAALETANVNPGRVTLRGGVCRVTLPAAPADAPSPPPTPRTAPATAAPQPVDLAPTPGGPTVRALVATRLADLYGVPPPDLRLAFDPADAALLDRAASAPGPGGGPTRTDVQPAAASGSARVPVNVFVYEGDRLVTSRLVTAAAQLRRTVLVARAPIAKGAPIAPDQVAQEERWLPPSAKRSPPLEAVVGQTAQVRLAPGAIIGAADAAAPLACKRGDLVYVHALSGPFKVQVKARAMATARTGELVELRVDGSRQAFTARMTAPGLAVKVIDGDAVVAPSPIRAAPPTPAAADDPASDAPPAPAAADAAPLPVGDN